MEHANLGGHLVDRAFRLCSCCCLPLSQALGLMETSMGPYDGDDCSLQG